MNIKQERVKKISVLMHCESEGFMLYCCILLFHNSYNDIKNKDFRALVSKAGEMRSTFDIDCGDYDKAYVLSELELKVAVASLEYARHRFSRFFGAVALLDLSEKVKHKLDILETHLP